MVATPLVEVVGTMVLERERMKWHCGQMLTGCLMVAVVAPAAPVSYGLIIYANNGSRARSSGARRTRGTRAVSRGRGQPL